MKYFLSLHIATMLTVFANPLAAEQPRTKADERNQNPLSVYSNLQKRNVAEEEVHVEVGSRPTSHVEWVQSQEEKEKIASERELSTKESVDLAEAFETFEPVDEEEVIAKATYQTWHPGAHHRPIAVSTLGDTVTHHDGSEWVVKHSHRYKVLDWLASDSIIILPNHAWFSSYYFRLVNLMTGADVEVNLAKGPIYNGIHSHWIEEIDYYNCEIRLEDNTVHKVPPAEWATLKKWLKHDTIIIGINDSWFSSKPNILINVNMLNYVTAGPKDPYHVLIPVLTP